MYAVKKKSFVAGARALFILAPFFFFIKCNVAPIGYGAPSGSTIEFLTEETTVVLSAGSSNFLDIRGLVMIPKFINPIGGPGGGGAGGAGGGGGGAGGGGGGAGGVAQTRMQAPGGGAGGAAGGGAVGGGVGGAGGGQIQGPPVPGNKIYVELNCLNCELYSKSGSGPSAIRELQGSIYEMVTDESGIFEVSLSLVAPVDLGVDSYDLNLSASIGVAEDTISVTVNSP